MNANKNGYKTTFLDEAAVLVAADTGKVEVRIQREQDCSLPNGEILFSFAVSGTKTDEIRQKLVNGQPIPECLPLTLLNVRRCLLYTSDAADE